MGNLKTWIVEYCIENNETPLKAVIGDLGGNFTGRNGLYKVLPWNKARDLLDYEFDEGYGGVGCHAIYVWTDKSVLFVSQYDGSTALEAVPRRPKSGRPEMPGG